MVNIGGRSKEARLDDRILGGLLIAFGGLRVGLALGNDESFGAEPSIALAMLLLGFVLLLWRR